MALEIFGRFGVMRSEWSVGFGLAAGVVLPAGLPRAFDQRGHILLPCRPVPEER